ncbi:hypothetical protein ACIQPR_29950 [Streptomyces sp. NPDC091280]|uniref:hypothetical protein n=1 Tax=unclassified Streptomyces TaxID=2593676 RepID=UPI00381BC9D1
MGVPSAPQPDPQSWVRGPKPTQPARPAADGTTTAPAGHPAPAGHRTPVGGPPQALTAVQPAVRAVAPAAPVQVAPRPNTPSRKATSGRPAEQRRGQPKRPRTALRGRSREDVGWVQAHGGSGATSLVEALGGVDVGARWPEPARGEPYRIVLVGRTSARGLRSVSQALGALKEGKAPQGLELLAVVLVADAPGRLPLSLLRRIRVLRSVARVHRVPWIPAWRTDGQLKYIPRQLVTLSRLVGSDVYDEGTRS